MFHQSTPTHILNSGRTQLSTSLSALSLASESLPTNLPPEIIEYIDQGRNPDIYNRELVEAVQRNNQYLKGKSEAFAGFRDMLAEEIVKAKPDAEAEVWSVLGRMNTDEVPKLNGEVLSDSVGH